MEIRRVCKEDLESFVKAYEESYRGLEIYAYRGRRLIKGYFKWLLARDAEGFMTAELDGKIVGFVACDTNWISLFELKKVGEIHEIFVLPNYRRMGVASKLLSSALSYAIEKGRDLAELWVGEANDGAKNFYVLKGFREAGKIGKWVRMIKEL
ncbi:MAG: GNAT family N-acetyltransferase [Archaeoglobaceae archaeon]|nr:GNAT family N-acetyltransferase [Archaeoglobaceae archaeon]MDW8128697.1 GNAT family N-acetyltransferase [Archaeoglobaceae archaeon]